MEAMSAQLTHELGYDGGAFFSYDGKKKKNRLPVRATQNGGSKSPTTRICFPEA